ncbi:hypothetical protein GIB67_019518, partial [Kingdonia uniflora]
EVGLSLDKAEKEVLGHAAKVVLTKEVTTIVGNGSTQDAVAEQDYEKEKFNERIAKLSGVIQVGAQTETDLKEKKLRVEGVFNATKAAVEEGIVAGGGCTLLRLAAKIDAIKLTLDNDEQKVLHGWSRYCHIVKSTEVIPKMSVTMGVLSWRRYEYPYTHISITLVLSSDNFKYDYNDATGKYEDLMAAGIIDPTKVFKESQRHDDSGNYFELSLVSCKCIGAYVKNKNNQNQANV